METQLTPNSILPNSSQSVKIIVESTEGGEIELGVQGTNESIGLMVLTAIAFKTDKFNLMMNTDVYFNTSVALSKIIF